MSDVAAPAPVSEAARPGLEGRRFRLVGITPEHHRALYELSLQHQVAFRWRFRGAIPPFEVFVQTLYAQNVLVQLVMEPLGAPGEVAGIVVAYHANLHDGHCSVATLAAPEAGIGALEGFVLFVRYLFFNWPLRKVYFDVVEFNLPQFASALRPGLLEEEGVLRKHTFLGGVYWDVHTLALYREGADRFVREHPGIFGPPG